MMNHFKRTVTVFLMDSDPAKRIKCHVEGTTCVAFKINREDLNKSEDRKELKQSGIYFLFGGTSDDSAKEVVYVGQASVRKNGGGLLTRLLEHDRNPKRNYWNEAVVFTTTDDSFGPTEISYLENYFCNLAKKANRYIVQNENDPSIGNISEEKQSTLEEFVYNAKLILGILNYRVFIPLIEKTEVDNADDILFYIRRKRKNGNLITAEGRKTRDGFVVLKGSYISESELLRIPSKIRRMRSVAKIDNHRILQEDLVFTSPSYAAAFVVGGNANGLTEWKTESGLSLKEIINSVKKIP